MRGLDYIGMVDFDLLSRTSWVDRVDFICPFSNGPMFLRISLLKPPLIPFHGIRCSLALRWHPVPDGAHYLSRVVPLSNLISKRLDFGVMGVAIGSILLMGRVLTRRI